MPRHYKVLRPLALPTRLTPRPTMQVAAGETFTVDDDTFTATSRFLRNRVVLGDLEEITEPGAE